MSETVELTLYELWRGDRAILLSTEPYRSRKKAWVGLDKIEAIEEHRDELRTVVVTMGRETARKAGFLRSEEV